jgi:peptidoglycan/LPS O-acetylase OafA/YrhL
MTPPGRVAALDVLRAVAILLVLGAHAPEAVPGAWLYSLPQAWHRCGWAGVDLFFALSGYLIVGLLLAERHLTGAVDVKSFAVRRVFKIYPPYLLFLAAAVAWWYGQTVGSPVRRLAAAIAAFWPAAAHLQNYVPVPVAPHLWSLAVEEHCYAVMLGIVLVAGRKADPVRGRGIPLVLLALFAVSWLGRCAYVLWGYAGAGPIGATYTHNRLDAVLAGSLAAWLVQRARLDAGAALWSRWKPALLAVGAACLVPTLTLDPYAHRPLVLMGVLPLQAVGFGLLLLVLAVPLGAPAPTSRDERGAAPRPPRSVRVLAFIGISSYSTYLWHMPFAGLLAPRLTGGILEGHPAEPLLRLGTFVAVSLGLGAVAFVVVEKPALAWRRRWLAAAKGPAARRHGDIRPAHRAGA